MKYQTFINIAKILNSEFSLEELKSILSSNAIDFEMLVRYASAELIVPAIYFAFKEKKILKELPEDFVAYLHEIAQLNTQRNNTLINEIKFLSQRFTKNNINYVFTKGAAVLVSNYLTHSGERMVGDIDVLIPENQIERANSVLLNIGYQAIESHIPYKHLNAHHSARLVHPNKIGAIELHKRLLYKGENKLFNAENYLKTKVTTNGICIGSRKNLLLHVIFNSQLNDFGYYYNTISLRSVFDVFLLSEQHLVNDMLATKNKFITDYFNKLHILTEPNTTHKSLKTKYFLFKLLHIKFSYYELRILEFIKNTWFSFLVGIKFISSSALRKDYFTEKRKLK